MRDHESSPETDPQAAAPAQAPDGLPFDPTRVQISRILTLPPSMRDAAISAMQQQYGNAYVQRMLAQAQPDPVATPHPMLREGSSGPSVIELQQKLDAAGSTLVTDGAFGPLTRTEVVRFQTGHQLSPDGIVGPLTWAALDATPDQADAGPSNLAVGDAEDPGGLQTLDPGGPISGSGGNDFGFTTGKGKGKMPVAPTRPPPVVNASKADLIAGGFANRGTYRPTSDGFVVPELDQLLGAYGTFWDVDVRALPGPDTTSSTKPNTGDSAGKGVHSQPPWIKALENKIIGRSKWDDDDRATQRLIEAYLRAWTLATTAELPPGAEQLMHQVGASETNGQAVNGYQAGKGASAWCAQASNEALIYGLYNRGIRFKTHEHSKQFGAELTKQLAAYSKWIHAPGHVITAPTAYTTTDIQPGDIITVVNGAAGPLSGHVATVVSVAGTSITYISGNAAGVVDYEGAIRIEEVKRETPPPNYNYKAVATASNNFDIAKQGEKKASAREADDLAKMRVAIDRLQSLTTQSLPSVDLGSKDSIANLITHIQRFPSDTPNYEEMIGLAKQIRDLQKDEFAASVDERGAKAKELELSTTGEQPVSRDDPRFVSGTHAPKDAGTSWVVEVYRTGGLAKVQMAASGAMTVTPNDPALEQGPTLKEQCPDAPADVINTSAK